MDERQNSDRLAQVSSIRLEIDLDAVSGPGRYAASEEIPVFGPDRAAQDQSKGDEGPVRSVTACKPQARLCLTFSVDLVRHWGYEPGQSSPNIIVQLRDGLSRQTPLHKNVRQMDTDVGEGDPSRSPGS